MNVAINRRPLGPAICPKGWIDLHTAIGLYANTLAGPAMVATDYGVAFDAGIPFLETGNLADFSPGRVQYERLFARSMCLSFGSACRAGKLRTAWVLKQGGKLNEIDGSLWHTEDPALRFRTFSFDPDQPFSNAPIQPCWLLVRLEDYNHVIDVCRDWYKGLPLYDGWTLADDRWTEVRLDRVPIRVRPIEKGYRVVSPVFPDFEAGGAPKLQLVQAAPKDLSPASTATRTPARVSQARIERWFIAHRVPAFEGAPPPRWRDCWEAAKAYFAPDRVVRELLIKARKGATPPHWSKPGPNREAQ